MKISIKRIDLKDAPVVQKIYERSPGYFRRVDHSEVLPDFAEKDIQDCPPKEKQSSDYEKIFCLLSLDETPVGIVDLHRNHPKTGIVYLGLLIISEDVHGKGIGRKCFEATEHFVRYELSATTIRLGVAEQNNVEGFWKKMGFNRNGHTYVWQGTNHQNDVFEMEKSL